MKNNLAFILCLCLATPLCATEQVCERIFYNNKARHLLNFPLEPLFENGTRERPLGIISTALYRCYVGVYEITNNQLYVKDIFVDIDYRALFGKENTLKGKSVFRDVFPGDEPVKMDWFNGVLVIPDKKADFYSGGHFSIGRGGCTVLEIAKGTLTRERRFTNGEYELFVKAQVEAFKKTDAYPEYFKKIKEKYNFKDDEAYAKHADFMLSFCDVFHLTTKILGEEEAPPEQEALPQPDT